jgi:uncharacterized protein YecE (DUF72 family)
MENDVKAKIGTSGYSYEDWRGVFYPSGLPKGQMLDFYSKHFDCVEVNSTYYAVPHPSVLSRMSEKTPDNFEFIVKVHRTTTHDRPATDVSLPQLVEAVKPLIEAGKFSGFLAQFPYSFKNTPAGRDYLRNIADIVQDYPLFVEFRNWTWVRDETYSFLRENHINYVNVDEPPLKGLIRPQDKLTGNLGYIRFHGRNTTDWWNGTNQTRYNYLYSHSELDEWMVGISRILFRAYKSYIFFNNHPQGKAVQNAQMLREMIENYAAGA